MINKFDENKSFDYENGFYLTSLPVRFGNMLAHYELYKKTIGVPGDIVECGVFKGTSLIQWATFRELLENEDSRKIIGFDIFGEFPSEWTKSEKSDQKFADDWNRQFGGEFITCQELQSSLALKGINNVELVKGDIKHTLPTYFRGGGQIRISLLHVDVDVYEPTKFVLEQLWDRVVVGGMVILDDYGMVEGATVAIDEFFRDKKSRIEKLTISHKPVYVIK